MKRILLAAASLFVISAYGAADAFADCPAAPLASSSDMVVSFLAANGTQAAPSTALASSVKEGMLIYDNTADALKICNGTAWQTLSVGGGGVTAAGSVTGAVQFRGGTGNLAADDTNFVWDDTNNRLGIGTATPTTPLDVVGDAHISGNFYFENTKAIWIKDSSGTSALAYGLDVGNNVFARLNHASGSFYTGLLNGTGTGNYYIQTRGANRVVVGPTGSVGIGVASADASALLDVGSTTKGFLPPRMTTTDVGNIATPADGLMVYDTDTDTIKLRANGAWVSLMGGSGSETDPQVGTLTATKWCAANAGGTAIDCTVDAPATGAAGSASEVQFRNSGTGAFAADSGLYWDNTNKYLMIDHTNWTGLVTRSFNALASGGAAPSLVLVRGRGTVASPTPPLTNDILGLVAFRSYQETGGAEVRGYSAEDQGTGLRGGYLTFLTTPVGTATGQERMRIAANGNVGIGTTSPSAGLHVVGTGTAIRASAASGGPSLYLENPSSSAPYLQYPGGSILQETASNLSLRAGANTGGTHTLSLITGSTTRMFVTAAGDVGIGTTSPRGALDVNGAVRLKAGAPTNDSAALGIAFEDNGDTGLFMTNYSSSATGDLNLYANATARMTVLGSGTNVGYVGIGTTAPASLLHVAGGVQLGNDAASCVAAKYGTLRYASDSLELCGTSGWVSLVSGALVSGTGAAGTSAAAVTNAGWQNYPGSPTLALPSAGTYFVTSQVYYTYGAGCGDVMMNWSGSNILYKSTDSKWQACGSQGTSNWSTYSHVITVSAATTLNAQYNWTNAGTSGNTQFGGSKYVKLNTGSGGGGGGGTPGGATTQVQYNDGGSFAGSANLVWDNTNSRLGIGTTTPAQKLDVVGTATANGVILKPAAGAAAPSAGTQVWDSDGTHAWRATGNVGIGAASPSYKLHVTGDGYITTSLGVGVAPASTIGVYSVKTGTNADGHGIYGYGNKVATASGTYYSAGAYNVARSTVSSGVTDSGWLIGTNVSSLRATAGDAGTLASVFGQYVLYGNHSGATSNPTTTNAYGVYIGPYQQTGTITNNYSLYLAAPSTGGTVTNNFGIYQASTAQKNYLAGNVGIGSGATSPAYTLDIAGTARATGNYYTNGSLYMGQDGTSTVLYGSSAANQYMSMYASTALTTGAAIVLYGRTYSTTEGRVSYFANTNTNDTTHSHYFAKHSSGGTTTLLASMRSNGNMYVYGDYTCTIGIATTVSCSSDRRLKTDIEPITGGLDSVLKLQPVTFKLKNPEKSQRQRMGFIAQDVEKIFPQAIDRDDQTDYLTMDYAMLVAPLVDAVKELNTKRLDLEAKVAAQGTEIETLKTQNADILKRLEALEATASKQ